jgi:NitT/TauT family transport system permease protein
MLPHYRPEPRPGTLDRMRLELPISVLKTRYVPGRWDVIAFVLVFAFFAYLGDTAHALTGSLAHLEAQPISLDPRYLPGYAAQTALRMLVAMVASLLFTFTYATLAAKSQRAATVLVPLLDILQSVPILGFSITIVFFLQLTPGRVAGAELAAIFLVFTSQAWNMAFSFYHSLRSIPDELDEAARAFHLGPWMRFWRLEVPFAMPALIWNMMMSMSGGWFFVVAAEAISVGNTTVTLPGVGSYIARAIQERSLTAIGWAIAAMFVVILIYDQLLFRPLTASADWFRLEQEAGLTPSRSWALNMMRRSRLISFGRSLFGSVIRLGFNRGPVRKPRVMAARGSASSAVLADVAWYVVVAAIVALAVWRIGRFVLEHIPPAEIGHVAGLGLLTLLRVAVLIALASVVWVPIGVYIGMRPGLARTAQPIAQFLAAFPVNLLFPIVVSAIVALKLDPNIWLSPLMILGTQWYILFNVIVGASSLSADLKYVGENLGVRGWLWWRRIALPAVFPFYVTGAITASGGSWNASIVAEVADWGSKHLTAAGLGAYIADATSAGDFPRTVLGIALMSLFVVILNRVFWRPLYARAERKFRVS